jgi:hypothetical protein
VCSVNSSIAASSCAVRSWIGGQDPMWTLASPLTFCLPDAN